MPIKNNVRETHTYLSVFWTRRSLRLFHHTEISVRGDGNLRLLTIVEKSLRWSPWSASWSLQSVRLPNWKVNSRQGPLQFNGSSSEQVDIRSGVKQDCVLAPTVCWAFLCSELLESCGMRARHRLNMQICQPSRFWRDSRPFYQMFRVPLKHRNVPLFWRNVEKITWMEGCQVWSWKYHGKTQSVQRWRPVLC